MWIRLDGRVGLDVGRVLRIRPDDEDLIWTEFWKGIGRWGVGKVGRVSIEFSPITVTSRSEPSVSLAVVMAPAIELPLSTDPPSTHEWLTSMSIPIHIRPTNHTKDLIHFAEECWMSGVIRVSSAIPSIRVTGGRIHESGWRGRFGTERSNVSIAMRARSERLRPIISICHSAISSTTTPRLSETRKQHTLPSVFAIGHLEGVPHIF